MARKGKGTKSDKPNYKYSRDDVTYWEYSDDNKQILSVGVREDKDKGYINTLIKIIPLSDSGKKIELEKKGSTTIYDEGFFSLTQFELIRLEKALNLMFLGKISQTELNHVNQEDMTGSLLEIVSDLDEKGNTIIIINIYVYENGEIKSQYTHQLNRIQTIMTDVDPETGEGNELAINVEFLSFYEVIKTSISFAGGLFNSHYSLKASTSSRNVRGGIAKGSRSKKTRGISSRSNKKQKNEEAESVETQKVEKSTIKGMFND